MRRNKLIPQKQISILAVDDDPIITVTIQDYFQRSGYRVDIENNPKVAVERIREGSYDILMLDFLMAPICGDQVVEEVRTFNEDIFIILLTGHKSMAPPVKTIRQLDIQGYYEKDDRFDQLELLVESCVKSIKQMRRIRAYESNLNTIVEDLPEIYHLQNPDEIALDIMRCSHKVLPYSRSFVCMEENGEAKWHFSGEPLSGEQRSAFSAIVWDQSRMEVKDGWYLLRMTDEKHTPLGVFGFVPETAPGRDSLQLLDILLRQAGAAIRNGRLHDHVSEQNRRLTEAYMQTIETLRYVVESRDKETKGHSERVSRIGVALARELGMSDEEVQRIEIAGMFHDIGKIGVPDQILLKEGPLTDEEFEKIKLHPAEGEKILAPYAPLKDILPVVRHHHERYNGFGYPDRLAGEDICLGARIIAVADAFDAMVSNRTYRRGLGVDRALEELVKGKGSQFDPGIVDVMLAMISRMGREAFEQEYCSQVIN